MLARAVGLLLVLARHRPDLLHDRLSPVVGTIAAALGTLQRPRALAGRAARQRALFADGGYLGPAAEACYWRGLVRGWASVARTDGLGWDEDEVPGVPWEEFSLSEIHK